ncbi:MAG: hypothetical protein LAT83_02690 [Kiritimatiellae bacterium]|nr:hypothetical protein [Kiritimatiellia bacterium]
MTTALGQGNGQTGIRRFHQHHQTSLRTRMSKNRIHIQGGDIQGQQEKGYQARYAHGNSKK